MDGAERHPAIEQILHHPFRRLAIALEKLQQVEAGQGAFLAHAVQHARGHLGRGRGLRDRLLDHAAGSVPDLGRQVVANHRAQCPKAAGHVAFAQVAGHEGRTTPGGVGGEEHRAVAGDRLDQMRHA